MALNPGTRLGAFEIVAPIGEGGMGEVYRARDTRLKRMVALKLISNDLAGSPDRLARFEREARAASALNHPAIVTIYDVGITEPQPWISMELVAGKTLRELVADGALPLRRALAIAAPLADGLAKAHEAGIVHRDLKPENVMVSDDGFAKILDFGLARLTGQESPGDTVTRPGDTRPGTVMGTLAYMSPEQASGAAVDFRSDQFSFGAVLYEMLTGARAFERTSSVDTLSAVLRDEPPSMSQVDATVPTPVRWIVERCLEKRATDRYGSTRDLARDLAKARDHLSEISASAVVAGQPQVRKGLSGRELVAWAATAALLVATGALLFRTTRPTAGPAPVRFALSPPENVSIHDGNQPPFEISPDGRHLALVGVDRDGTRSLWVRALDSLSWQQLAGTSGALDPFWSPDTRHIGFFTADKVMRVPASGGDVLTIADAQFALGGSWNRDDVILFWMQGGIYQAPASGGAATPVPMRRREGHFALWPVFIPGSRDYLFFGLGGGETGIYLASLDSQERTLLTSSGMTDPTLIGFSDPDLVLYVQNRTLFAHELDRRQKKLIGEPIRVADDVAMNAPSSGFSVARNGGLVYWPGSVAISELTWVDRRGRPMGVVARGAFTNLAIAPDGRRVAVDRADTYPRSIWTIELARGAATKRIAFDFFVYLPSWSGDSARIVYGGAKAGPPNIYISRVDQAGAEERKTETAFLEFPTDWTSDDRYIVFCRYDPKTDLDVWLLPLSNDEAPRPIIKTAFSDSEARVSPDRKWMAYTSTESGIPEVYVTDFPEARERHLVSAGGGSLPVWRRNSSELYYRSSGKIMAVAVGPEAAFEASPPILLFEASSLPEDAVVFDVAPDGRFLLNRTVSRTSPPLTVVSDWRGGTRR